MEEEIKVEIMEDLTAPYRLSIKAQLSIFSLLMIATVAVAYSVTAPLDIKIAGVLFIAAYFYPIIIKIYNNISESIGMALYGASMFTFVWLIIKYIGLNNMQNTALLIIFIEVLGIEMFHHIVERFRIVRSKKMYLMTAILSVIFFIALLTVLLPLGPIPATLITITVTIVFAYAILPERPF